MPNMQKKLIRSKSGRHIFRSFFQEYLDKAETYRQTEAYLKAIRKRSMWVEPLFGEAKEFHCLRRLRKVNIEGVMTTVGQDLKRLIKHDARKPFFFSQILFSMFDFPIKSDFFNSLQPCATKAGL